MFRARIVDDEPMARMGLRDCFGWAQLECVLVGEADGMYITNVNGERVGVLKIEYDALLEYVRKG